MKEKDINKVINKSFAEHGFSHKIQDPPQAVATTFGKNPFDGFSVVDGIHYYWETKLIKGYKAFSFSSIQPHQNESLTQIKYSGKFQDTRSLVIFAVWEPRKTKELYIFDIGYINYLINQGVKSIKKKEILQYREQEKYLEIKKEKFDYEKLEGAIIYGESQKEATMA